MYLVDTSAWIGFLRGADTPVVNRLRRFLRYGETVGLTAIIYQEILQGAESIQRFEQFRDYFGSQRFYHPLDDKESYVEAARLYFSCRRQGITIRSTVDCLIARIAIEHDIIPAASRSRLRTTGAGNPRAEISVTRCHLPSSQSHFNNTTRGVST